MLTPKERLKLEREITEIQNERANLRSRERSLNARSALLKSQPLVSDRGGLRNNIEKIIPKHLRPQNIGHFNEVLWNYWFPFDFDFGTDPTYDNTTRETTVTQVDQEAGFLLTSISRSATDPGQSGAFAPLHITVRDLQSTRQFNDEPIPLQQIGQKGEPTCLDTPLYFPPNARIELTISSWIPKGSSFATTGSGKHQIVLGGFRVREKDGAKALASIFV